MTGVTNCMVSRIPLQETWGWLDHKKRSHSCICAVHHTQNHCNLQAKIFKSLSHRSIATHALTIIACLAHVRTHAQNHYKTILSLFSHSHTHKTIATYTLKIFQSRTHKRCNACSRNHCMSVSHVRTHTQNH